MIPKNTHTLVPTATHRIYRLLTATLVALSAFFFSSCNEPVRDYFEKWTKEVSIAKYELIGIESYTDKDGNLCIASDQDVPVTLFMINPYHYSNIVVSSGDITTTATGTFPSITQDANDTTLLRFTYGRDFLLENECGGEIGATINLKHPMNSTVKEYTFSLKSNSRPPLIEDAAIMTTGTGNDQKFVLAFRCPPLDDCKEDGGIHHDIVSITIDGQTYPVTPASNGELVFGDSSLFLRTRPTPLNAINKNFDDSELAVYFCQNEGTNDETKNGKTYTITFTDSAGFTNSRTIDARLPGMSSPLVYDNDNADSEAATLDETAVNILHIDNTPDAACSTVTIKLPSVNDIGLPLEGKNPQIYWELKDISGNSVNQNPAVTSPSSSDVSLKIPTDGEYTLKVYATATAHTPSSEKTYRLKLEYAQLPPPVVKKTTDASLTAGTGASTNNYVQVGNDGKATVKVTVPDADINGENFLNTGNVTVYYNLTQGLTGEDPTDSSDSITGTEQKSLDPGQWVITAVAKKPGYRDSEVVTYKVRAYDTNIYVKNYGTNSGDGNDTTGDGTQARPYASITRAVEEIGRINIHTNTYTIHVVGVVTGNQVIENISGKATSITIQGDDTGDALDGNNSGTVLANKDTVSITIRNLTIKGGSASGLVNQGTVTLQSGAVISGNSATSGGGISNSGTLTIESGAIISGNSATYGGGIYINSTSGTLTIKGGEIKDNTVTNGGAGSAIYALKTFTVTQAAQINSSNDVYLANGIFINISGTLSNTNVANITPGLKSGDTSPWHRGTQVLSGNVPNSPDTKFSVNKTGWSVIKYSSSSGILDAPLYVTANGNNNNSGASADDGYATIAAATSEISRINDSNRNYTINIVGTVKGAQTISDVDGKAEFIKLDGSSSGKLDAEGTSGKRPLEVSSQVPVIIENLTITGGNHTTGGGILLSSNTTVKLGNGAVVTGNTASNGGGGVRVQSGAKLFMFGSAVIGNNSKSTNADSSNYANKSDNSKGGGIFNSGTVYIGYDGENSTKAITNNGGVWYNYAKWGGGIYNSGTVYLNTGNISFNGSGETGGGIDNASGKTVYISGGTLSGNSSAKGGAINLDGGTVTMTGGTIGGSGNSDKNTVSGSDAAGGAIYQNGTFNVSGSAYVYPGSVNSNDVYLPSSKYVTVNAAYSGSSQSDTNKMAITPATWKRGTQVLDGSQAANYPTYFKGSEADWTTIKDTNDSNKVKLYTGYTIWVAGTSNTATGVGTPKTSANGGRGTKSKPYSSISEAVEQCWTTDKDFIIKLSGIITGTSQTIPAANSTNKTGLAKSITLEGVTGNTSDVIDRNLSSATSGGSALTIKTVTPVTIKKIKITKGYTTSSGGGIYVSVGGASLTLGEGALITGNSASGNGGGIYFGGTSGSTANLIMNSTAAISGNSATGTNSQGGGVYLYYANLCMSGNALIGDTSGTSAATSDSTGHSNMAVKGGGVSCGTGANIYLGYASASDTGTTLSDSYGIRHNYASSCGGGVFLSAGSITFKSGSIYANGTAASTDNDGGGIWQNSGTTVTMSGGTIAKNKAYFGGGVYAGGTFTMSGGTVGDSSKTTPADGSSSSTYSNNAAYGGGIYAPLGSTLTLNGGYVSYNYASSDGGGIYAKGTSSFKANCNYNIAGANGGGILSSALSLTGGNIKGNKANNGGGLYAIGTISMSGGTVADNEATRYGGGINIESGTFTMTSGTIGDSGNKSNAAESTSGKHSNISVLGGGGIYIANGTVSLNGGTVGYNYCSGGGGGGICFKGGTLTVKNYVQYNTGYTAGGLSVQADGCTLDSATFTKNNASTNGGAAFISFGKTLNVKGNLSMPNPAEKSNDIFLQYYSTEGKYGWINVADSLGGSGIVAMITPTSYNAGKTVVKASSGVDLATQSQRFSLLPNTSDSTYNWLINTDGTLKQVIGTKLAPNAVGDIVYSDGSASPSSLSSLSNKQKSSAVAVIFSVSGTVKKGVGLREVSGKKWAKNASWGLLASDETDGSSNMTAITSQTTYSEANYPAFYWANNYTATGFTSGWYIPAKDELTALMDQKDTVNNQITKIGGSATKFEPYVGAVGDPIPSHDYWSSTKRGDELVYISGDYGANYQQIKTSELCYTRAIRKF